MEKGWKKHKNSNGVYKGGTKLEVTVTLFHPVNTLIILIKPT